MTLPGAEFEVNKGVIESPSLYVEVVVSEIEYAPYGRLFEQLRAIINVLSGA